MNPQQRFTAVAVALAVLLLVLTGVGLLLVEWHAVSSGGNSTISELFWTLWANQPWVVFIVSHTIAAPFWYLMGHFTAQSSEVYKRLRDGTEQEEVR